MVPFLFVLQKDELRPVEKEVRAKDSGPGLSVELDHEDYRYYFPSVDLLTAQVLSQKALLSQSTLLFLSLCLVAARNHPTKQIH